MNIQTVKLQGEGYLLNGNMSVPKADGNSEYEAIKQWLAEGNTPEPEFTQTELDARAKQKRISELKQLLAESDFRVLPDYQARSGKTDEEMAVILNNRNSWYTELQELTK